MKKLILSLCCIAAFSSCKKETVECPQGPAGPAGPQGPAGTGSSSGSGIITGNVSQYDQYGIIYTTGLNTTTVSIDGANISSVTDAMGNYTLTNVAAGIFDISYNKPAGGLIKATQIIFPGTGTMYLNQSVGDKATYMFTGGIVRDTMNGSNGGVRISLTYTPDPMARVAIIVFGKTPDVDIANPASYDLVHSLTVPANKNSSSHALTYSHTNFSIFPPASPFYAKVYPIGLRGQGYYDYIFGKEVYTGVGTPLPGTFTLIRD